MTDGDPRTCPSCGQLSPASSTWCEACGHDLAAAPKPRCVACGEPAVEDDGYCHSCGHRQPEPRDHVELIDGQVSAVSDRGQRHQHNEDAVAVSQVDDDTVVMVVCDGVSSTPGSAGISALAAFTAVASLAAAAVAEPAPPAGAAASDDVLEAAVEAARLETGAATLDMAIDELNPPSTTLVAVAARRQAETVVVSVAWLGDSRAYWIDGQDAHLLTSDHEVDGALTRWVGIDASHHLPQIAHYEFPLADDGDLIVCSDGMWRYFAPEIGEPVGELIARLKGGGLTGLDLVRAMVDHANERGGHDNISVASWAPGSSAGDAGTTVEPPSDPSGDHQESEQSKDPTS